MLQRLTLIKRLAVLVALMLALPNLELVARQETQTAVIDSGLADKKPTQLSNSPSTFNDDRSAESAADNHRVELLDPSEDQKFQGITFSDPVKFKWRISARIQGGSRAAQDMLVTMPVPTGWPEQGVAVVEEEIPGNIAEVSYRDLDSGVKQLVIRIPVINARADFTISMTFLVLTSQINPPQDTSAFVRPKSNHRAGKPYLGVGPQINYRNSKLRKLVKEIVADKESVWFEIESIYDWVRENIEDRNQKPKDSLSVFRSRAGCNEDKVGLFVAMCRANKIPARFVWVQGTQYAEFMLVDSEGKPHWFPCNVGGIREFGSISEPRIILQKGDSVRVPEKETRQKFVGEFAICRGKSRPSVKFSRQLLPAD